MAEPYDNHDTSLREAETLQDAVEHIADDLAREIRGGSEQTGKPKMIPVDKGHEKLFSLIESGDHVAVEKFLTEKGQKVKIVPKIGCSPMHYSKQNVANIEDKNEDSPLIKAVNIDCKMVEIVIKYGGNPNHTNKYRDSPLSIAATRGDKNTIDVLLRAGASLRAAVRILTAALRYMSEEQLKQCQDSGFCVRPLTVLLAEDVYLKCRDPIRTAFHVCRDIKRIKNVRDEFKIEFELLMKDADIFAYSFLNHCDKMFEAREILTHSDSNLLETAIYRKKKKFVSHPFSQQIINESWNGETANTLFFGKFKIALKYCTSLIGLPLLFLKFLLIDMCRGIPFMESSFSDLMRLLFTPCLCFVTDAINYVGFLAVMISTCLVEFGVGTYEVTTIEYVLYYCVFARIFIEVDQLIQQGRKRYFSRFWNYIDVVVISLLVAAAIYKGFIKHIVDLQESFYQEQEDELEDNTTYYKNLEVLLIHQHRNSMNVNYIYAVAEFILTIRLMSLLEIHKSLGTMLIALKYLVADVIKFGVILLIVIMGTSISIYSMTIALNEWNAELTHIRDEYQWPYSFPKNLPVSIEIPGVFETFTDTIRNILWGTFGLLDVVNLKIKDEQSTTDFINVMMILYVLLSCVLLLNMLIGILSSTFDTVKENCDIEWKFARSQLLKEYSSAQPFLFPFFPILFPFIIWYRAKLTEEQKKKIEKGTILSEESERDKLISAVSDRYLYGNLVRDDNPDSENQSFETKMKFKKQKAVLLQIAARIKSKRK